MTESHFERVTRQGIEKNITEAYNAGDSSLANYHLGLYPYGKERPSISTEMAHHIAHVAMPDHQITEEIPVVTPDML